MSTTNNNRKLEFTGYLSHSHQQLFAYVHSLVRNLNDADDILQKVAIVLWEKFDEYDRQRSFYSWACGVARFEVLNFVRKRGRDKLCFNEEVAELLAVTSEEQSDLNDARQDALPNCLEKLPDKQRSLIETIYLAEKPIAIVADNLGRSTHSVYNSLRKIRKALFDCVKRATEMESI